MPIYAYRCAACGHAKDVLRKISDPALTVCPACGADTFVKQVTAAGFQLKGSGWYVTDFRGGDSKGVKPADDSGNGEAGNSGEAKNGDAGKKDGGQADSPKKEPAKADAAKSDAGQPAAASAAARTEAGKAASAPAAPAAAPAASSGTGTAAGGH